MAPWSNFATSDELKANSNTVDLTAQVLDLSGGLGATDRSRNKASIASTCCSAEA